MTTPAYVIHSVPGRARIRVPLKIGDAGYFAYVHAGLSKLKGVSDVRVNHITGSILLTHNDITLKQIQKYAGDEQLFSVVPPSEHKPTVVVVDRVAAQFGALDQRLRGITGNSVDTRTIMLAGMIAMAIIQIQKRQVMVPAVSLVWYAYQLLATPK